jgi:hypothetical protein
MSLKELFASQAKAEQERQKREAQWDELAASEGIPKKGWHIRKLPGTGPMSVRIFHNGQMVRAVQKVSFEIDAEFCLPKMKLEVLLLGDDQLALDLDEEQVEVVTAKTSPFPADPCR